MSVLLLLKIVGGGFLIIFLVVAISLVELLTQLPRYRNYWQKNNAQPAIPGEVLYVALGDSTAQGVGATGPTKGYVGLIAEELAIAKKQPVRTINLSKSGARIKDVLETQLPEFEKLKTDRKTIVTIEIGANDMSRFDPKVFEKEMDEVMRRLPKHALVSDIPYFGGGRHKKRQANVIVANRIMNELAAKHGFELVPVYERTRQNSGLKTIAVDFVHPSSISYKENWAPPFLERIL